jgi:anti-sigma B factor antagonist
MPGNLAWRQPARQVALAVDARRRGRLHLPQVLAVQLQPDRHVAGDVERGHVVQVGDVAIVDLSGRITLGDGSGVVRETVKDLLKGGKKNLLLNLGDVSYIDSSGLGELVSAYATGANQGAQIKLLNVQKRVHDLIQLTKLYSVFESFTNETAAVQSFGAKAASV